MARSSEPRNSNPTSPEGASRDLSPQRGRNARAAEQAHVAHGGASLFEDEVDKAVERIVDTQQASYPEAYVKLGLPQPETPALGNDGVSIKLSDRYEALKGIARAAAKRSSALGAESDSAWNDMYNRGVDPEEVVIGSAFNAKRLERKNDNYKERGISQKGHYEKLVAGEALLAAGLHPDKVKALREGTQRSVERKLGVGVGQPTRDKVLRRVWDGTPEKAKNIALIKAREAARRKRLRLDD